MLRLLALTKVVSKELPVDSIALAEVGWPIGASGLELEAGLFDSQLVDEVSVLDTERTGESFRLVFLEVWVNRNSIAALFKGFIVSVSPLPW